MSRNWLSTWGNHPQPMTWSQIWLDYGWSNLCLPLSSDHWICIHCQEIFNLAWKKLPVLEIARHSSTTVNSGDICKYKSHWCCMGQYPTDWPNRCYSSWPYLGYWASLSWPGQNMEAQCLFCRQAVMSLCTAMHKWTRSAFTWSVPLITAPLFQFPCHWKLSDWKHFILFWNIYACSDTGFHQVSIQEQICLLLSLVILLRVHAGPSWQDSLLPRSPARSMALWHGPILWWEHS
jgi:hypothetical protein